MSAYLQDKDKILDNSAGPAEFRTTRANARLSVSGSGTLKSWNGNTWDAGETFTGSKTITSPGRFQVTLDVAGYCSVQEPMDAPDN